MCGPRIVPSATTRAKWTPSPESSRMLVNPAETATSASFVARAANTARGVRAISSTFRVRIPMKWPWTSHIPGIRAGTLSTVAPAADGAPSIGPAYAIVGPSTTSAPFLIGSPRPGISTSVSIRSIELAIAGERKNVAARGDTENLMGGPPFPRAMAGLAPPEVDRALEARFPDALEYTRRLLRQPSVSATGEGIRECSELVRQMMADIGCKTRTWSKGGHPLVIGELDVGAPITLIVYEMYDVQPVGDLNAWQDPPFAAEIRDLPGVGKAIIARGSTNSKGALANHLFTWKTIRDVDEMPVNLIILAEGEEEISSANFIGYIRTHRRDRERLFRGPSRRADDLPRGQGMSLPDRLVAREPAGRRADGQRNPQLERGVDRLTRVAAAPGPQHVGRREPAARDRWHLGGRRPADAGRLGDGQDAREDVRPLRMAPGGADGEIQIRPAEGPALAEVPVRADREHLRHLLRVHRTWRHEDGAPARSVCENRHPLGQGHDGRGNAAEAARPFEETRV